MNAIAAFVLGLVIGWVIEWIIDWVYWRRRTVEMRHKLELTESRLTQTEVDLKKTEGIRADLQNQLAALKADTAARQEKFTALEADHAALQAKVAALEAENTSQPAPEMARQVIIPAPPETVPAKPDDLQVIKGIGPVIAKKLNDAGICTFRELAAITPQRLREIVGDVIQRLANEEDILVQAQRLAAAAAAAVDEAAKA